MKMNKNKTVFVSNYLLFLLITAGFIGILVFEEVNDEGGVEAVSTWIQTSKNDFNNGTFNNTTIQGSGDNAELRINLSELNQWTKKTPSSNPSNRDSHAMASIYGTGKVVLFGGYGNFPNVYKDDTWIYDLSDNTWSEKTLSTKPSDRYGHKMAPIDGDDKVVLFGGRYRFTNTYFNDTWVYDLSANTWTNKTPMNGPSSRGFHAMASIPGTDQVILFGGFALPYSNETWIYDLSANTWTQKFPMSAPSARICHGMASIDGDDKIILFGGFGPSLNNETWVYDVSLDDWTKKIPTNSPSARVELAMASIYATGEVLLFGGADSIGYNDETWIYNLNSNDWVKKTPINPTNNPNGRDRHSMASISGDDRVILFGGFNASSKFNDTWVYKYLISTKNGTFISEPYDTCSNSSFRSLSWLASTPVNTSIRFQLRTAAIKSELTTKDFLGPDGTTLSFYTSSPTNIWSGHEGDRWIQYKVYLNINIYTNSPRLKNVTISYNCLPETIVTDPSNGSLLTNNKPIFKWIFKDFDSEQQKAFQVQISNDINFENISYDSGEQIRPDQSWEFPIGTTYTVLPDGTWYWKVRTMDSDNNWTEYSLSRKLLIDTQAPSSAPIIPINNGFYNSLKLISGIANDLIVGSGVIQVEIAIKRLTDNYYWNGSNWVQFISWLETKGTNNWTYDSSAILWTSGIRYRIQSRAIDNANNIEQPIIMNIFTIDKDSPKSFIENPIDKSWLNKLDTISGNSYDISGSGINKVEITIMCLIDYIEFDDGPKKDYFWNGTTWSSKNAWLPAIGTTQWSYDASKVLWCTGDHYTIRSRAIDKTNNVESNGPRTTFMYDDKPPENLRIFINNETEYTKSSSVILSIQAEDIGSGLSQMLFSSDSAIWSEWEPFNTNRPFELPTGDGKKTIYFKARDLTGNIAESVFDTIILDTTPPEELSIVIDDYSKYTNSKRVKINLQGTDRLSGIGEASFCYNGLDWLSWEPFTQIRYLTFPNDITDGENKIYFKAKDNVGNIADPVFDTIILDTLPPFSLSILINDGSLDTNSTSVTIALQAFDNTSGVSRVSFSDDGVSWSDWEDFKELKSYDLSPGNGEKTIYFKVSDKAGNIGGPISDKIILNMKTPQKDVQAKETPSPGYNFWMIMFILAIILFIIIIVGIIIITKRKKPADLDLLPPGALTIRHGGLSGPVISMGQIPKAIDQPQLPSVAGVIGSQGTSVTAEPTPIPMLTKFTQTTTSSQQPTISVHQPVKATVPQPLPALPPAETQEVKPEISSTITTTTPEPTIAIQSPSPKLTLASQTMTTGSSQTLTPAQPQPPQVQPTIQAQQKNCSNCGLSLKYYQQNNRYYCYQCKKYE